MNPVEALTIRQLRALAAVARSGTLTAAAAQLGLTAPAIHTQIKGLEAILQTRLLQRSSDSAGSRLTEAGEAMLVAAERVEVILSQCVEQVQALARGQAGRVRLGVVSTAKYFAPRLVKRLKDDLPDIEIVLRVGNREQTIAELAGHVVDLAIMGRPPRAPAVLAEVLGPHPHGIVAAPDHPLAGRDRVEAAELLRETFLAREIGSGTRTLMTRYIDRIGEGQPVDLVEMGTNETIKQAAIAGLGVGFLSLHTVQDELEFGRLVTLKGPGLPLVRQWFVVRPEDKPLTPATERVRAAISTVGAQYLPQAG